MKILILFLVFFGGALADLKEFRQGIDGYTGASDVTITTQYADNWNYYNGLTYGDEQLSVIFGTDMQSRSLLRFADIHKSLPAGVVVTRAVLTLSWVDWDNVGTVEGFFLNETWNAEFSPCPSGTYRCIGWLYRQAGQEWGTRGGVPDTGLVGVAFPDNRFEFSRWTALGNIVNQVDLSVARVQEWINKPSSNNGFILRAKTTAARMRKLLYSSRASNPAQRPYLSIYYGTPASTDSSSTAPGRVIFVSTTGDDKKGTGSVNFPLKTGIAAVAAAFPYDTIRFRGGVHAGSLELNQPHITIESSPGEKAIIVSPVNDPVFATVIFIRPDAQYTTIRNVEVVGGFNYGIFAWTTYDWGGAKYGARNLIVQDVYVHHTGDTAIKVMPGCDNVTLNRVEISSAGIRSRQGTGIYAVNADYLQVRNCYIRDCTGAGIKIVNGGVGSLVDSNVILRSGYQGVLVGFVGDEEWYKDSAAPQYWSSVDTVVSNNVISDTAYAGIGVYGSLRPLIFHNTLTNVARIGQAGILFMPTTEYISYDNQPNIVPTDVVVINNIVTSDLRCVEIRTTSAGSVIYSLGGTFTMQRNVYWVNTATQVSPRFADARSSFVGALAGWQALGIDAGSVAVNPVLLASSEFKPSASSPAALHNGMDLPSRVLSVWTAARDIAGVVRPSNKPTIGAYQRKSDKAYGTKAIHPAATSTFSITGTIPVAPISSQVWKNVAYSEIFVSPAGDDSTGKGTRDVPYKTVGMAFSVVKSGQAIVLRAGTYETNVDFGIPNITLKAYLTEVVKIVVPITDSGRGNAIIIRKEAPYTTITNLDVQGGYYYALNVWDGAKNAVVTGCKFHHAGASNVKVSPFSLNTQLVNCEMHSAGQRGSNNQPKDDDGADDPDAERAPDGLFHYGHGIENANGNIMVVRRCFIHDNPGAGIKISGGSRDCQIDSNLIVANARAGIWAGFYEDPTYMDPILNPTYYEIIRPLIVNNIIADSGHAGIGLYSALNARVLHNTVLNAATIAQAALLFNAAPHRLSPFSRPVAACLGGEIRNNIFAVSELSSADVVEIRIVHSVTNTTYYSAFPALNTLWMSNNLYVSPRHAVKFTDRNPVRFFTGDLAGWKNWTSLDADSDFSTTPRLDENGAPLSAGSYIIDSAYRVKIGSQLVRDCNNALRNVGTGPDVGAFEFGAPGLPRSYPPTLSSYRSSKLMMAWPCENGTRVGSGDLFVATNGSDVSNCYATQSTPFKTLGMALKYARPGDVISMLAGTYKETVTVQTPRLTVRAAPGAEVKILSSWNTHNLFNVIRVARSARRTVITGLEIVGGSTSTVLIEADNCTISKNRVHGCGTFCIEVGAFTSFVTVIGNDVRKSGMKEADNPGILARNTASVVIRFNYVHDLMGTGIQLSAGCKKALVDANLVRRVGGTGILVGYTDDVQFFDMVANPSFYGSFDAVVTNNIVQAAGADCVAARGSLRPLIASNTLVGCKSGCGMAASGIQTWVDSSASGQPLAPTKDLRFINNVVSLNGTASSGTAAVCIRSFRNYMNDSVVIGLTGTTQMDYNLYYNSQEGALQFFDTHKSSVAYTSLSAWATATGAEAHSVSENPQLDANLRPQASSPCLGASASPPPAANDYTGLARPSVGSDLGAFDRGSLDRTASNPLPSVSSLVASEGYVPDMSLDFWELPSESLTYWQPGYSATVPNISCSIFPASHAWNTDISAYGVHPKSENYLARISRNALHPDFGGFWDGVPSGIPFVYVSGNQPKVPMSFGDYASESDAGPYPFPARAPVEGGLRSTGDRHIITIDKDTCRLYETWHSHEVDSEYVSMMGFQYTADAGAIFDLNSAPNRPAMWTSSDAAGLAVFPGLARYEEVAAGAINHALRFTVVRSQRAYIAPATHYASSETDGNLPPMGLRIRIKASYNCAALTTQAKVICVALQKYGMILADNGSDLFISGAPHPSWDVADLAAIKGIPKSALEVIYTGAVCTESGCGQ